MRLPLENSSSKFIVWHSSNGGSVKGGGAPTPLFDAFPGLSVEEVDDEPELRDPPSVLEELPGTLSVSIYSNFPLILLILICPWLVFQHHPYSDCVRVALSISFFFPFFLFPVNYMDARLPIFFQTHTRNPHDPNSWWLFRIYHTLHPSKEKVLTKKELTKKEAKRKAGTCTHKTLAIPANAYRTTAHTKTILQVKRRRRKLQVHGLISLWNKWKVKTVASSAEIWGYQSFIYITCM